MTVTTKELLTASDMLRAEFPRDLIVDASYHKDGWHLLVIPPEASKDSQTGIGATVEDALADLRDKIAAADPIRKLQAQAEKLGYSLTKNANVEARANSAT